MKHLAFAATIMMALSFVASAQDSNITLRRGYRQLLLGMEFDAVESALQAESSFYYRGSADVSLVPSDGNYIIDSSGRGFIDRGLFQFHEGALYSIAIYVDTRRIDFFQVFEQLRGRYGDPADLDPERAIWEDEETRIVLERPLTVRYLDLETFLDRQNETSRTDSAARMSRDAFLSEF